jgi:hypothetical protein
MAAGCGINGRVGQRGDREKELKERLNLQDAVILRRLMDILDPPALPVPMVGSWASAASACGGLLVLRSTALHWVRVHSYDRFVLPRLTIENSRPSVKTLTPTGEAVMIRKIQENGS